MARRRPKGGPWRDGGGAIGEARTAASTPSEVLRSGAATAQLSDFRWVGGTNLSGDFAKGNLPILIQPVRTLHIFRTVRKHCAGYRLTAARLPLWFCCERLPTCFGDLHAHDVKGTDAGPHRFDVYARPAFADQG